jgi:hypothetical protein
MSTEVILAGAAGALGVFLLGQLKEWWLRRRELEGLMRLLEAELDYNDGELQRIHDEMVRMVAWYQISPPASAHTWEQVRARIAALLRSEPRLRDLTDYYLRVRQVNERMASQGSPSALQVYASDIVKPLQADGQRIREWMRKKEFLLLRF